MSVYIVYISLVAGVRRKLKSVGYLGHGRRWMGLCRIWRGCTVYIRGKLSIMYIKMG